MEIKEMFNLARVPSILMLGIVYVAYVLIGGVVFWKLEGDLGQKDISLLLLNKNRLLRTYTCLNQGGLEEVAQVRHRNIKRGRFMKTNPHPFSQGEEKTWRMFLNSNTAVVDVMFHSQELTSIISDILKSELICYYFNLPCCLNIL